MDALKFAAKWRKENNSKLKIYVSCVAILQNKNELKILKEKVEGLCDEIVFYYPCSYAGQTSIDEFYCDLSDLNINTFSIKHDVPCPVLWNSINVTAEGYLSICCSEADNRLIIENLKENGVRDAWLGEKMTRLREKHMKGDISDTPCQACVFGTEYRKEAINRELFGLALSKQDGNVM